MKDRITIAVCLVAMMWLLGWAISTALGHHGTASTGYPIHFPDYAKERVILDFKPGDFIPAGGVTSKKKLVAIQVDDDGRVICSPTVFFTIEKAND